MWVQHLESLRTPPWCGHLWHLCWSPSNGRQKFNVYSVMLVCMNICQDKAHPAVTMCSWWDIKTLLLNDFSTLHFLYIKPHQKVFSFHNSLYVPVFFKCGWSFWHRVDCWHLPCCQAWPTVKVAKLQLVSPPSSPPPPNLLGSSICCLYYSIKNSHEIEFIGQFDNCATE